MIKWGKGEWWENNWVMGLSGKGEWNLDEVCVGCRGIWLDNWKMWGV